MEIKYEELEDLDSGSDSDVDADALFQLEEALPGEAGGGEARAVDETADRLDGMMDVVFGHLRRRIAPGGHLSLPELGSTLGVLLRALQVALLQTYKSKFTQFLLFFLCSMDPSHAASASFCSALSDCIEDAAQPQILRIAAASYAASFLARAAFLPPPFLLQRLDALSCWGAALLDRLDSEAAAGLGGSASHPVLEAVCQARQMTSFCDVQALTRSSGHSLYSLLPYGRALRFQRACCEHAAVTSS